VVAMICMRSMPPASSTPCWPLETERGLIR
jgi:hypothetical protein